jgi:hypothetical protein
MKRWIEIQSSHKKADEAADFPERRSDQIKQKFHNSCKSDVSDVILHHFRSVMNTAASAVFKKEAVFYFCLFESE